MCVCVDIVLQVCVRIDVYVCMCMVTSHGFVLEKKVTSKTHLHTAFPQQHNTRVVEIVWDSKQTNLNKN